jgi:ArsR family transcriptional regulator, arsenate/arsenite/antimonite-responsive transcriptional repressor
LQYSIITIDMGATKTDHFTESQNELANWMKAMGHPARIAIIEFLLKTDSCICGDIVNELPLSQPTVSQHLKELKNAGIIQGNIEGTAICYCLNPETIAKIQERIGWIFNELAQKNQSKKCC